MTHRKLIALSAAATLCFTFAITHAQDPTASADKTFLTEADEGNTAEIAASKMALKKSQNPDVRAFAQQMITDHMKLRADTAPFDQKMGVMTPQPLNPEHQAAAQQLSSLSGAEFDKAYIQTMDQDHHKTLAKFQNEIATTQNATLKTTVQKGADVVQQHTAMADRLAQQMNIPTAAGQ